MAAFSFPPQILRISGQPRMRSTGLDVVLSHKDVTSTLEHLTTAVDTILEHCEKNERSYEIPKIKEQAGFAKGLLLGLMTPGEFE